MKKILLIVLFCAALPATPLFAQDAGKRKSPPVKVAMKKFDKALDEVFDFLQEPKGTAPMAKVTEMQAALLEAKQHEPRSLEQQPADKRAAFLRGYKIEINKTIRLVLDLEDALLQQDYKQATKLMDRLDEQKKAAHKVYKPKRRRRRR